MNRNHSHVYIFNNIIQRSLFSKWLDNIIETAWRQKRKLYQEKNSLLYNFCYWKNSFQFTVFQYTIAHCLNIKKITSIYPKAIHQLRFWRIFFVLIGLSKQKMNIFQVLFRTQKTIDPRRWCSLLNIFSKKNYFLCNFVKSTLIISCYQRSVLNE